MRPWHLMSTYPRHTHTFRRGLGRSVVAVIRHTATAAAMPRHA
jgi:hypothetical protein